MRWVVYLLASVGFVLALGLRLYQLDKIPSSLFCDEAGTAYDADQLLKTGHDWRDHKWPLLFEGFGEYKSPILIYASIPFVAISGLNEFATRLPSVFFGMGCLVFIYLILWDLAGSFAAIAGLFISALMIWLFHYHRVTFDYTPYHFFFLISVWSLLRFLRFHKSPFWFFLGAGLACHSYSVGRMIAPAFVVLCLILYRREFLGTTEHRRSLRGGLLAFTALFGLVAWKMITGPGLARLNQVSIFKITAPWYEIARHALTNYFIQYTPRYLYIVGEPVTNFRHFSDGLLPTVPIVAYLFLVGALWLLRNRRQYYFKLFALWFLIYGVPGLIVENGPFSGRSVIGSSLLAIVAALGVQQIWELRTKSRLIATSALVAVAMVFAQQSWESTRFYFEDYPKYSTGFYGWQYGSKELIAYFVAHEGEYQDYIFEAAFNGPDIFPFYYGDGHCKQCRVGLPESEYKPERNQIFAVTPHYLEEHPRYKAWTILHEIRNPFGQIALIILKPTKS